MTTYNLATLLEKSAQDYPSAPRWCSPDPAVRPPGSRTPRSTRSANMVASLLALRGIRPGDKGRAGRPNPYFTVVCFGIAEGRRHRRPAQRVAPVPRGRSPPRRLDAKAYFCFRGHAGAPMGEAGRRFRPGRRLRALRHHRRSPRRPRSRGVRGRWHRTMGGQPATFDSVAADEDDTAVILHLRHRAAQGRGRGTATCATTRSRASRSSVRTLSGPTPTSACCRSSTPSGRPSARTAPSRTAAPS